MVPCVVGLEFFTVLSKHHSVNDYEYQSINWFLKAWKIKSSCKWTSIRQTFFAKLATVLIIQTFYPQSFYCTVCAYVFSSLKCSDLHYIVCMHVYMHRYFHLYNYKYTCTMCCCTSSWAIARAKTGVCDWAWIIFWFTMIFANPNICITSGLQFLQHIMHNIKFWWYIEIEMSRLL